MKTTEVIPRKYHWSGIRKSVERYVVSCDTCARDKTSRQPKQGLLKALPIPDAPWQSTSIDFITKLPKYNGIDSILVIVD